MKHYYRTLSSTAERIYILDILRGISALLVVIHHFYQQFPFASQDSFIEKLILEFGSWGVGAFFVLSGYCIHASCTTKPFDRLRFLKMRFYRIYPLLITTLIICSIIGNINESNLIRELSIFNFFSHLSLTSSFIPESRNAINAVTWTVILEMQFYIAYMFLYNIFKSRSRILILTIIFFILSLSLTFLSTLAIEENIIKNTINSSFFALFWQWLLGVLLASYSRSLNCPKSMYILVVCFLLSFFSIFLPFPLDVLFSRFIRPLILVIFIYQLLNISWKAKKSNPLVKVGDWSYAIYFLHPIVIWCMVYIYRTGNTMVDLVIVVIISIFISYLSFTFIEKPGIKLGKLKNNKIFKAR